MQTRASFLTGTAFLVSIILHTTTPAWADSVVEWGYDLHGETNVTAGLSNIVAIGGGEANNTEGYSLALRRDGTMASWGSYWSGTNQVPMTVPPGLSNAVAISGGPSHCLALRANGTVAAWGENWSGQTNVPSGLSNVVAIAAGAYFSLALREDGTLASWGENSSGQTRVPGGLSNIVALAAGGSHSLALRADGTVCAWGENGSGQTDVPAWLSNVVAVCAGGFHSIALRADGTLVAWGDDAAGQSSIPAGVSNIVAIAAGSSHSAALRADGTVLAWGKYWTGGGTNEWYLPMVVPPGLSNVVSIASTGGRCLALVGSGPAFVNPRQAARKVAQGAGPAIFCAPATGARPLRYQWQQNGADLPQATNAWLVLPGGLTSQAGFYSVTATSPQGSAATLPAKLEVVPLLVQSQPRDQRMFLGGTARMEVRTQASPPASYQWRCNGTNLPHATNATLALSAVTWPQDGVYSVLVSNRHGVLASRDARLIVTEIAAWGQNNCGQGDIPAGLSNVVAVAAGGWHGLALRADGTVVAWGGWWCQMTVPTGLSQVLAIAAGWQHNLALTANRTVVSWGDNYYGQTNIPVGLSNVVAVAAGYDHSLALRADGTVVGWGRNDLGQATVPSGLSNVIAVSGGNTHSLALRADGTVVVWGDYYHCPWATPKLMPTNISGVVSIVCGQEHDLTLWSNGTVTTWGNGVADDPPLGLSNITAVAAGDMHDLALRADGTVEAWGWNEYGATQVPEGLSNVLAVAAKNGSSLALIGNRSALAPFRLLGPQPTPEGMAISFPTRLGHMYVFEYTPSLKERFWAVRQRLPGDGKVASFSEVSNGLSQGFYRVRQVP